MCVLSITVPQYMPNPKTHAQFDSFITRKMTPATNATNGQVASLHRTKKKMSKPSVAVAGKRPAQHIMDAFTALATVDDARRHRAERVVCACARTPCS
jgi:hypothetical protein